MRALLLAVALGLCSAASAAEAGTFQISPTRIDLAARGASSLVVLTNTGNEPMRIQVSAFAWDQALDGEQVLGATRDLVVFPTLFAIAPGETRKVKVGITVAPQAQERTYRMVIEELPGPPLSGQMGLRVLTRMSVPIFQAPLRAGRAGAITNVALAKDRLRLDVENRGTVSVMLKAAQVTGKDAGGRVIWRGEAAGWYLLAGGKRRFELEVPADKAALLARVDVEAATDQETWKQGALVARE